LHGVAGCEIVAVGSAHLLGQIEPHGGGKLLVSHRLLLHFHVSGDGLINDLQRHIGAAGASVEILPVGYDGEWREGDEVELVVAARQVENLAGFELRLEYDGREMSVVLGSVRGAAVFDPNPEGAFLRLRQRAGRVDVAAARRGSRWSASGMAELVRLRVRLARPGFPISLELAQARLRARQADLNLEHATIRAPFSGVITERLVQVGARVGSGAKLMSMIKLDDMIARVYVPGQYLTVVRPDQPAVITSDFLEGREFEGWVKRISPIVDPHSGTFKVTVGLRDRWEHLRPGIFVNVRIVTDTHTHAVLVPKEALVYDGGNVSSSWSGRGRPSGCVWRRGTRRTLR